MYCRIKSIISAITVSRVTVTFLADEGARLVCSVCFLYEQKAKKTFTYIKSSTVTDRFKTTLQPSCKLKPVYVYVFLEKKFFKVSKQKWLFAWRDYKCIVFGAKMDVNISKCRLQRVISEQAAFLFFASRIWTLSSTIYLFTLQLSYLFNFYRHLFLGM